MAHREGVLPLPKGRYGVAISWDRAKASVDLDLQALIVDDHGLIVDAVFYNNLSAFNGCVGHSGDKKLADGKEYSESVWVNLAKLPKQVALIIFVVAAYGDCMLKDVTGGKISVLEDWVGYRLRESKIERAMADVDAVFMMKRDTDDSWQLVEIEEPPSAGSHFLDILEPTIGDLIRKEIPGAPAVQKVTFFMEKGAAVDFQQSSALKRLSVGISGKLPRGYVGSVDIDVSAVLFSKAGKIVGAVDCESNEKLGVAHSGDYVAGHSNGDDEVIMIDLLQVPQKVAQIFFLLNVRGGETFQSVERAYARVADQGCAELARYEIVGGAQENGLIIARIFRTSDRRWSLQALGMFCMAESWQEAKDFLKEIFKETPEKVQGPGDGMPLEFSRRFSPPDGKNAADADPGSTTGAVVNDDLGSRSQPIATRGSSTGTEEIMIEPSFADRTLRLGSAGSMESAEPPMAKNSSLRSCRSRCITARSVEFDGTGSRCTTTLANYDTTGSLEVDPGLRSAAASDFAEADGETSRKCGRRINVRKGTFRLTSQQEDPAATEQSTASRPLKFKVDMPDSDTVPVDDEGTTVAAAKPRGICAGGCSWASRMQLFSACAGSAS